MPPCLQYKKYHAPRPRLTALRVLRILGPGREAEEQQVRSSLRQGHLLSDGECCCLAITSAAQTPATCEPTSHGNQGCWALLLHVWRRLQACQSAFMRTCKCKGDDAGKAGLCQHHVASTASAGSAACHMASRAVFDEFQSCVNSSTSTASSRQLPQGIALVLMSLTGLRCWPVRGIPESHEGALPTSEHECQVEGKGPSAFGVAWVGLASKWVSSFASTVSLPKQPACQ
jgi:hypothetical protein